MNMPMKNYSKNAEKRAACCLLEGPGRFCCREGLFSGVVQEEQDFYSWDVDLPGKGKISTWLWKYAVH